MLVLKSYLQTERLRAYDPWCLSCRKKQDLQPRYLGAEYDLYRHLKLQRSKEDLHGYILLCRYPLLGVGNELVGRVTCDAHIHASATHDSHTFTNIIRTVASDLTARALREATTLDFF